MAGRRRDGGVTMSDIAGNDARRACHADLPTICAIAWLLMPALTLAHEVGGHAAACLATHGALNEIGSFYVDCTSATAMARRMVAVAGPATDAVLAVVFYRIWRACRTDMARLITWFCWLGCGFEAAGYLMFSGILGLGDLGPDGDGGLAPLPYPLLWRGAFAGTGLIIYVALIAVGQRTMTAMIGPGSATRGTRRTIALRYYAAFGLAALVASLLNPKGLEIILTSALASSLGAIAGLITIGFGARGAGEGRRFIIARNTALLVLGPAATVLFALALGPTIRF